MANKGVLHKSLPHDVTLGALLVVLLASAFLVVLPRLQSMQALPQHYYNLLPVANQTGDIDRDGIPDNVDVHPYGDRNKTKGLGSNVFAEPEPVVEEVAEGEEGGEEGGDEGEAVEEAEA